jgi:hypothetical protein
VVVDVDPDLIQSPPKTPSDGLGPWLKPVGEYMRRLRGNGSLIESGDPDDEPQDKPLSRI